MADDQQLAARVRRILKGHCPLVEKRCADFHTTAGAMNASSQAALTPDHATCLTALLTVSTKEVPMKPTVGLMALTMLLASLTGCSYLYYPRAGDYAAQAKGATGVDTLINLTNMMEASAAKAKGGKGKDSALDDYHNQLHALLNSFCNVTEAQANSPAYDLAVTHKKELKAIFKRLWKFKDDQPQRDQHLDLSIAELKELRDTLQTLK